MPTQKSAGIFYKAIMLAKLSFHHVQSNNHWAIDVGSNLPKKTQEWGYPILLKNEISIRILL
jgi:hypothetical protein